jgi:hypothetical protein
VGPDHKLHLQQLTIGRDYGVSLEVLQGIQGSDWIVVNPADSLEEGQQVNVKEVSVKPASPVPPATNPPSNAKQPATAGKGK